MGTYQSLYMDYSPEMANCLDDETADNIEALWDIVKTGELFKSLTDVHRDFEIFNIYAEVIKDIADCHFESAFEDFYTYCEPEGIDCSLGNTMENAKHNLVSIFG